MFVRVSSMCMFVRVCVGVCVGVSVCVCLAYNFNTTFLVLLEISFL